jgi:hypothetical protein
MPTLPIQGDQLNPAVLDMLVGARNPDVFANTHDIPPTGWLGSVSARHARRTPKNQSDEKHSDFRNNPHFSLGDPSQILFCGRINGKQEETQEMEVASCLATTHPELGTVARSRMVALRGIMSRGATTLEVLNVDSWVKKSSPGLERRFRVRKTWKTPRRLISKTDRQSAETGGRWAPSELSDEGFYLFPSRFWLTL